MKRIAAVVRPEKLEPLKEALFQAKISGMTIYQVHGCGNQHGWKEYFRGSEVFLNMIPKVKFEIIVEDSRVDEIVDVIVGIARTGEVGDGKIFISSIDSVVRVRTGEKDEAAVSPLLQRELNTSHTLLSHREGASAYWLGFLCVLGRLRWGGYSRASTMFLIGNMLCYAC